MRRPVLLALLTALAVPALAAAANAATSPTDPTACAGAIPVSPRDLGLPEVGGERMTACVGKIQPGAQLHSGCTANWVVRDETGALYIGTAGHCVGGVGDAQGITGVGHVGRVAFTINQGVGRDFALIRLDPAVYARVDPSLCHWGGPTGVATFATVPVPRPPIPPWIGGAVKGAGVALDPPALLHYGWGIHTNQHAETRARVGVNAAVDAWFLTNVGNYNPGDSGSPIMYADGRVAGVVTHSFLAPPSVTAPDPTTGGTLARVDNPFPYLGAGLGFATRFDHALALAGAATGHAFTLVTSDKPVLATAVLEG